MIETQVTHTLEYNGRFFLIEHLQVLIKDRKTPTRVIETPVYEYA